MSEISKRLRDICLDIRRKPVSLSELIPLMQQAADEIDELIIKNNQCYDEGYDKGFAMGEYSSDRVADGMI